MAKNAKLLKILATAVVVVDDDGELEEFNTQPVPISIKEGRETVPTLVSFFEGEVEKINAQLNASEPLPIVEIPAEDINVEASIEE